MPAAKIRTIRWTLGKKLTFEWDVCPMCSVHVRCPVCGNNCCNAAYGEIKDKLCSVCPLAYQFQYLGWKTKTAPKQSDVIAGWPKTKQKQWLKAKKRWDAMMDASRVPLDTVIAKSESQRRRSLRRIVARGAGK